MSTQKSELRYFHPLLIAATQNEDGVCQFSPTCATNRLPINVPWASSHNFNILLQSLLYAYWKFVPPLQSGYQQGHSAETAVLRMLSDILQAVDIGDLAALVF